MLPIKSWQLCKCGQVSLARGSWAVWLFTYCMAVPAPGHQSRFWKHVLVVRLGSLKAVLDKPLVYRQYGITGCHVFWQTHAQASGQSLLLLAVLPEAFRVSITLKAVLQTSLCSAAAASCKFCAWFCFSGMYQGHLIPSDSCRWTLKLRTGHKIMVLLEIALSPLALCSFILSCIMQCDVIITKGFKTPF